MECGHSFTGRKFVFRKISYRKFEIGASQTSIERLRCCLSQRKEFSWICGQFFGCYYSFPTYNNFGFASFVFRVFELFTRSFLSIHKLVNRLKPRQNELVWRYQSIPFLTFIDWPRVVLAKHLLPGNKFWQVRPLHRTVMHLPKLGARQLILASTPLILHS